MTYFAALMLALAMAGSSSTGSADSTDSTDGAAREREACLAGGGCVLVSRAVAQRLIDTSYQAGRATCESRL